jgi:hypothetical protein
MHLVVRTSIHVSLATAVLVSCAVAQPKPGQVVVRADNPRWFEYHERGPFFMAGPGDPEGFLYRGRLQRNGTRKGDQRQLIRKLTASGANSIYLMAVRSHGGDGDSTHNPFKGHDENAGVNHKVLKQWGKWFKRMDRAGIVIFFIFYDDGSEPWVTGDVVGSQERAFLGALVGEFDHFKHLIWVVAEEYQERFSPARVSAIAAEIRAVDQRDHPIAVHKLNGLRFDEFADDPNLDQFAIQFHGADANDQHEGMLVAFEDAAGRYNLNMAESPNWGTGEVARKKAWAVAMGGAYVMAFEMDIETTSTSDLEDLGRLRRFMEATRFQEMEPRDDLARDETLYVLAEPGASYIAYADSGQGALGLADVHAGHYELRWLDIASGDEVVLEQALSAGVHSFPRPASVAGEAALYLHRIGD